MRTIFQYRHWLLCLVLALPGILVPQFDYMGPNRTRYSLGLPPGMDLLLGGLEDGHVLHFQPDLVLLVIIALWVFVIHLACRARLWAIACSDWRGMAVQALLTVIYCALVLWFLYGTVQVIWDWHQFNMQWVELERSDRLARRWLPYLYWLGAGGVLAILFIDSLRRRLGQRLFHLACAVCLCYGCWRLTPFVQWQLKELDASIQYAQEQQATHK
jgi:hypothetical protein